MVQLVPVDYNPFEEDQKESKAPVPVDYNPFEEDQEGTTTLFLLIIILLKKINHNLWNFQSKIQMLWIRILRG